MCSLSHDMTLVMEMSYDLVFLQFITITNFWGIDSKMSSSKNAIEHHKILASTPLLQDWVAVSDVNSQSFN